MVERNALFFHLDRFAEDLPELYMDEQGHLSVEAAQRVLVYTQSILDRPTEVVATESAWEDWWALVQAFIAVYAPGLVQYRDLAPLTYDSAEALSRADVRYLTELKNELRRYIEDRGSGVYVFWPTDQARRR